jgi:hypothetical protein
VGSVGDECPVPEIRLWQGHDDQISAGAAVRSGPEKVEVVRRRERVIHVPGAAEHHQAASRRRHREEARPIVQKLLPVCVLVEGGGRLERRWRCR